MIENEDRNLNFIQREIFKECFKAFASSLDKYDQSSAGIPLQKLPVKLANNTTFDRIQKIESMSRPTVWIKTENLKNASSFVMKTLAAFQKEFDIEWAAPYCINVEPKSDQKTFMKKIPLELINSKKVAALILAIQPGKNDVAGLGVLGAVSKREFDYSGYGDRLDNVALFVIAHSDAENTTSIASSSISLNF